MFIMVAVTFVGVFIACLYGLFYWESNYPDYWPGKAGFFWVSSMAVQL